MLLMSIIDPPGPGPSRWSLILHVVSVRKFVHPFARPSGEQKHTTMLKQKQATTYTWGLVGLLNFARLV